MSGQPPPCFAIQCPLAGKGTGFCLDSGDPKAAKIALTLEAPGREELIWQVEDREEIARRRRLYPELEERYITRGMPVVGKSGGILWGWGLASLQISRRDVYVTNTLRCLPPKVKDSQYPVGDERKRAEACCGTLWGRMGEYGPTVALVNIHPAAIAREPSPLPLMIRTFEKAKHFSLQGERPLVLCGGKAVQAWLGYGGTVQTWLGHYERETSLGMAERERRREVGMGIKVGPKVKKVRKLTARTALELLLRDATREMVGLDPVEVRVRVEQSITEEQYAQMMGLIAPKGKK